MSIEFPQEFIREHYDIVWQHPEATDWNTFLLAERHEDKELERINGSFISECANAASLVLLEGAERGAAIDLSLKTMYQISSPYLSDERIIGWDAVDAKLLYSHGLALIMLEVIAEYEKGAEIPVGMWSEVLCNIPWDSAIPTECPCEPHEMIASALEIIIGFIQEKILPLDEKKNACPPLSRAQEIQEQAIKDAIKDKALALREGATKSNFPQRTQSMINALRKASTYVGNGRIFLIAGIAHLRPPSEVEDGFTSTRPLFDFLKEEGKATVILKPKVMKM